jgi:hypothetical protein
MAYTGNTRILSRRLRFSFPTFWRYEVLRGLEFSTWEDGHVRVALGTAIHIQAAEVMVRPSTCWKSDLS